MKNLYKKINALLPILLVFGQINLFAQSDSSALPKVKSFEIVGEEASRSITGGYALYSYDGLACGKIAPKVTDTTFQYEITADGKAAVTVEALSGVIYNEVADRILVYGQSPHLHKTYKVEIIIYDDAGGVVKNLGLVFYHPYKFAMSKNGDLYIAGKISEDKSEFEFKKFTKDGTLVWAKKLGTSSPENIAISETGNRIVLEVREERNEESMLLCLDKDGKTIGENRELSSVSHLAFSGDDNIIACTGRRIYIYESKGLKRKGLAQLPGYAIGQNPIICSPDGSKILIACVNDSQTDYGYKIQDYDETAVLTHESSFDGQSYRDTKRVLFFENDETLKLLLPNTSLTLKMEN